MATLATRIQVAATDNLIVISVEGKLLLIKDIFF